jgi:hypothetical protein
MVGLQGVSSYYFLGMMKFNSDLTSIRHAVVDLQQIVDRDPYFKRIGTISKKRLKNGFYFHATDDIPEVRMIFFKFLGSLDCTFEAVAGKKIPSFYIERHKGDPHKFYADLLSHLLYTKLAGENKIGLNIAERGMNTRLENLRSGLQSAEQRFAFYNSQAEIKRSVVFNFQNQTSEPLLNIADYFCWSIQRVFEKGEARYYEYLLPKIKLIVDVFDEEGAKTGRNIYTPERPLTAKNEKSLNSI